MHWDPKQQELRTHLRPRLDLEPYVMDSFKASFGQGPYVKDSFKVSFGFMTLWRPRLIKDTKNVKNHWFYWVFAQKCWKSIGFTVFSLKSDKKALVLLCFRSKMLKKHRFYCVFAQTCWKSIGFIVFSRKKVENALVLLCFRSKVLKKHWFYCVFAQKCWKTIGFTVFSLKNVAKPLVLLCFRWKMLKNHWFYCVSAEKYWKPLDFHCLFDFSLKLWNGRIKQQKKNYRAGGNQKKNRKMTPFT